MSTETLTAPDELADRNQRSHGPLADELLAERPGHPRATARVIVAFNGSPAAKDALRLGDLLALSAGSELLVVCVFPPESLAGIPFEPRATRIANGDHRIFVVQDAEAVLAEARAMLSSDLAVTFRVLECASALRGLRQLALSEAADVLILGSTRHGLIGRLWHRRLARGLLREPPCAVTVVPHRLGKHPRSVPGQPERLVPGALVDRSDARPITRQLRKGGI